MVMSPWPRFFRPGPPCRLFTVVIWLARRGCRAHTWGNRGRLGTGGRQSGARWSTWGVETACSRSWSSSVHRRRRPWRSSPSPSRLVSYTSAACSIVVLKLRLTVPLQLSSKQIQKYLHTEHSQNCNCIGGICSASATGRQMVHHTTIINLCIYLRCP